MIVLTAQGASTYVWSDGTTSPTFSLQLTNNTTVSVTGTTNGCSATLNIPITKYDRPTLAWIQQTGEICYGQTATLEVGGALNYTWSHDNSTSPVVSLSPTTTTTYTVTGVDGNG